MDEDGIKRYPSADKKTHMKNVEQWTSTQGWFSEVYPKLSKDDWETYDKTTRCDICAAYFHKDNQRCADVSESGAVLHGVLCQRCKDITVQLLDLEHTTQIRNYLKGKKI
jgi:hypothetical protein